MRKLIILSTLLCASSTAMAAGEAKNVIVLVGHGLGMPILTATRIYKYGEAGRLNLESLASVARVRTASANALTTDESAALTALMTGNKVNNGVVAMGGCGGTTAAQKSLLEYAKAANKAVGVVGNGDLTGTAAALYAHGCGGVTGDALAAQLVPGGAGFNPALADGVNVIFGGGGAHFTARGDARNLITELTGGASAYTSVSSLAGVNNTLTHVIGLFNAGDLAYDFDRGATTEPSLAQMTTSAIDVLAAAGGTNGYFLVVDAGNLDRAAHTTNSKRVLAEAAAFDDAVGAAIAKAKALDPGLAKTLIVATGDHDSALVINGYAKRVGAGNGIFDLMLAYRDGSLVKDQEVKPYTVLSYATGPNRQATRIDPSTAAVTPTQDGYLHEATIKRAAAAHGGADVPLAAGGAGSAAFKGNLGIDQLFGLVKSAMGL
jgi:alkaline phosphatase